MILTLVPSNNGTFPGLKIEATSDAEAEILAAHVKDRHGVWGAFAPHLNSFIMEISFAKSL